MLRRRACAVSIASCGVVDASTTANSSPPSRETAPVAGDLDEPVRDLAQQLVAGVVPERVVDLLEAVEVDQQHRHVLPAAAVVERVARGPRGGRRGSTAR